MKMKTALALMSALWAPQLLGASGTAKSVSEAYSNIANDRFDSPGGDKLRLLQGVTKLNAISHPLDVKKLGSKTNPAIGYLSFDPMKLLAKNEIEYRNGVSSRAAYATRRITMICSECHASLAANKPDWKTLAPQGKLTLLEWGEFYRLAARPDDALLQYEKILNDSPLAASQSAVWERAALNIVALGVESSSNAYTFVDLVSNALSMGKFSKSQRNLLSSWRVTGKAWGSETNTPTKPFDMLSQARKLMNSALVMDRKLPKSGFVNQTRAMLLLKKVSSIGGPDQKARAFLMAGELREKLPINGPWLHSEDYYEACVRVSPKGTDAKKCLLALKSYPKRNPKYALNHDTVNALSALVK